MSKKHEPTIGDGMPINVTQLLESRMLVQASSGFGKSWLLRRLLEQTAGLVQQIVIDPEGEFASLREKHDFIIAAAHGGDALAHPKTAKILAERLLETGVSAVLDIYDIKKHERAAFVRIFLETVMNAPKRLWHPVLFVLDEAHLYCPEKDSAESAAAVIDLATRGRKRGFGLVAATQRIAKFNKDAAAELMNKLIGRTGLDIDVKRAGDELGMTAKEAFVQLRSLSPGQFFAFGPALSPTVTTVTAGEVLTTHPKSGSRQLSAPPKPSNAILKVLPQLADLPKEAEAEAKTMEELRKRVRDLERDAKKPANDSVPQELLAKAVTEARESAYQAGFQIGMARAFTAVETLAEQMVKELPDVPAQTVTQIGRKTIVRHTGPVMTAGNQLQTAAETSKQVVRAVTAEINGSLPPGEAAVLRACIQYPNGLERSQLTVLTGYKRSSRDAYIARLKQRGFISDAVGGSISATVDGIRALPDAKPLPTGAALQEYWLSRLPEGERACLSVLLSRYPNAANRTDIDSETNYKRSSRDAYLSRLASKELVTFTGAGMARASDVLFD